MNDPLFASQAPPPRYLLESDSSDEEGQGEYPYRTPTSSSSRSRIAAPEPEPIIEISWESGEKTVSEASNVLIGIGQSGRYIARKLGRSKEKAALRIGRGAEQVGKGWILQKSLLVQIEEADGGAAWAIANALLSHIQADKW